MEITDSDIDIIENEEEILQNQNPMFLTQLLTDVSQFFINYGWFLLFFVLIVIYFYTKLQPYLEAYLKKKADDEYAAKYHKNPDVYNARMIAMEESRRRMQEKLNVEAEEYKMKMQQKEEQKRQEWIERQVASGASCGTRLGQRNDPDRGEPSMSKGKKSFKQEYNPLMGSGGSGYKAPKRSPCGGGGCGK